MQEEKPMMSLEADQDSLSAQCVVHLHHIDTSTAVSFLVFIQTI